MEITKSGNIKIQVSPERHYQGQFVGHEYYKLADVQRAFPAIADFAAIDAEGFDLGQRACNDEMVRHYCAPFRRVGHIVA